MNELINLVLALCDEVEEMKNDLAEDGYWPISERLRTARSAMEQMLESAQAAPTGPRTEIVPLRTDDPS